MNFRGRGSLYFTFYVFERQMTNSHNLSFERCEGEV